MTSPDTLQTEATERPGYAKRALYLVVEGHRGGDYITETTLDKTSRDLVIKDLIDCQWDDPQQVIEIDLAAGTALDVTEEIAAEILAIAFRQGSALHESIHRFCVGHVDPRDFAFDLQEVA